MAQKPEIQYVDQFYIYGNAAPAAAPRKKESKQVIPREKKEKLHRIYVDPVALTGILSAVILLTAMIWGGIRLNAMWQENELMKQYVSELQLNNATLKHNYRISYDVDEIAKYAQDLGLVPESEVETRYIRVTVPEHKKGWTFFENVRWFFEGLFE